MMERCRVKDILRAGTIMPQGIPKWLEHEALRHGVRDFAPGLEQIRSLYLRSG